MDEQKWNIFKNEKQIVKLLADSKKGQYYEKWHTFRGFQNKLCL